MMILLILYTATRVQWQFTVLLYEAGLALAVEIFLNKFLLQSDHYNHCHK